MTNNEHALIYLAEECAEISEQAAKIVIRATKALRFGLDEVQAGEINNNAVRLYAELGDLLAVAELAIDLGIIKRDDIDRKKEKVAKYEELSRRLGILEAADAKVVDDLEEFDEDYDNADDDDDPAYWQDDGLD